MFILLFVLGHHFLRVLQLAKPDVLDKSDNEAWGKIKVEADIRMSLVPTNKRKY